MSIHAARLATAGSNGNGNILVTNEAGFAVYANDGIAARTGFSVGEIIDSKPGKLWGGHMPRPFYERLWHTVRTRRALFAATVTNQSKDGHTYTDLLAIAPLEGANGTVQYLALRPLGLSSDQRFLSEWRRMFTTRRVAARIVLPWLRRWFPKEADVAGADPAGIFADWIDQYWVSATRERFRKRIDDRSLIEAAQRDPIHFQAVYEKYVDTVRGYFSRHIPGNYDQVSDLTQDTFIRAFERLGQYEVRNAAYDTYLLRIAHSVLLNSFRQHPTLELTAGYAVPAERTTRSQDWQWIWETPTLSRRERTVLSAYYREGYSLREISYRLDVSENAAKLLLSRARKKIRHLFE